MALVEGGTGDGYKARVDENKQLHINAQTIHSEDRAVREGRSVNINTGRISISATSAVLYVKNNGANELIITGVAIGVATPSAGFADVLDISVIRNPTTGTLISDATAVDMKSNKAFGSSEEFTDILAYKGASGKTVTDGADNALVFQNGTGRAFLDLWYDLPKGKSIAIKIDPNLSSGTVEIYAAVIAHVNDPKDA